MQDQTSRLGVKGDEDLGGGLKAIFKMEFGVELGNGTAANTPSGWGNSRNSYVGLAGGFGTVLMGRHDTPYKMASSKLDFFGDTNVDFDDEGSFGASDQDVARADIGDRNDKGVGLFDSRRVNGAIAYVSPSLAGFSVLAAIVQTEAGNAFDNSEDPAGAYSLGLTYSNGPFFGSLGYENMSPESLAGVDGGANPDYEKWRVGFGILDFNRISASFIYEDRTNTMVGAAASTRDTSSWQLQAAYEVMPGMKVKGMYGEFDGDNSLAAASSITNNFNTWALGMEHILSKRTDIQVLYRKKDVDTINGSLGVDYDIFAVQLDHSF
jgi:predicted porin